MDKYMLSVEGRARYQRTKVRLSMEELSKEGWEILDYLYEHNASTVAEIEEHTGLTYAQFVHKLESFLSWGYIEKLFEP